jgi:hypothetical protein
MLVRFFRVMLILGLIYAIEIMDCIVYEICTGRRRPL